MRTKHTPFSVVLALIFPNHQNPSSAMYQTWVLLGRTVVVYWLSHSARGTEQLQGDRNHPRLLRRFSRHQFASSDTGDWFGGADGSACPVAQYHLAKTLLLLPAPRTLHRGPSSRFVHQCDDPTSTANRLVPRDLLHLESLKRRQTSS